MKNPWSKYATKERLIKKGYFRKHSDGGSGRKAREAGRSDRLQQSRESQEKEIEEILDNTYHKPTYIESSGNSGQLELGDNSGTVQHANGSRNERNEEISEVVLAIQDIPGKRAKRKRKTKTS